MELPTDEAIAPTRGADWDDNGVWRVFHEQKWTVNNDRIRICFNTLNGISYAATDMLRYHPTSQQQAEARFIRAWVMYLLLDLFDQVPYRDPGESLTQPARVRRGMEALNYIIGEIDSIDARLPQEPVSIANKYAASVLLMKCYLNKAIYANREHPGAHPSFEQTDMDNVIALADEIISSNRFSFSAKYFDDFAPDNTTNSRENIFTQLNVPNNTPGNALFLTGAIVLHYNQASSYGQGALTFNGFTTLSDFYDKFEPADKRKGMAYRAFGAAPNPGNHINVGFLIGQQYDLFTDDSLKGAAGPLNFTREVKNIELGTNLDVTGIRPLKYFPDFQNYWSPGNDFVYFRFSDVLLMKAEAILRGGTPTNAGPFGNTALSIVNAIRTDPSRGATAMAFVNLDSLLDERGRELWWEGWRRQDLIRFEKFLDPLQEKDYQSDPKYLLFPIPNDQLAVNPKLQQNHGY